jgi:hypothetical protein
MNHFVEIRSYNLKDGPRDEFHRLFLKEALPMLKRWKIDVVAEAFYGSEEWRQGLRK